MGRVNWGTPSKKPSTSRGDKTSRSTDPVAEGLRALGVPVTPQTYKSVAFGKAKIGPEEESMITDDLKGPPSPRKTSKRST